MYSYTLTVKKTGREIKETLPFTIATKIIKYLGINLLKEIKDLYSENYKTLMKEIKDNTNIRRDIPCSWGGRINIVKMIILPKAIYRFIESIAMAIKLPVAFFIELEQNSHNLDVQKTLNSQSNLQKEKWSWRNHSSRLQTILPIYSHQDNTVLAQKQKYRTIEQDIKPRNKPTPLWAPYL